ncbi:hypothetical protein JXA47_14870 [Candidatus Sumerlaeota bacterium]|nr:hypothetical protein [Candidatus Sumerlaeota bacterium]
MTLSKRAFLFPTLVLLAATLLTWRPWVGHGVDDVMLWAATTSLTHDGDTDLIDDLMHASNPPGLTWELICATWPTGAKLNPYPVGFAVVWAPVEWISSAVFTAGLDPAPRFHPRVRAVVSVLALVIALISLRLFMALAARAGCGPWPAALAAGTLFVGSSLILFTTRWPAMTHQLSALAVAGHLWALLRWREDRAPRWAAAAGLLAGLMILVRWQNALYLVVALALLMESLRQRHTRQLTAGIGLSLLPMLVAVSLQPLVWRLTSGHWLLIPQGEEYLVSDTAYLAILFSGYHGLFTSHPGYLLALVGLAMLCRRDPWLGISLLIAFALLVHVNQLVWDWWGAGAFGQRRFCSFVGPACIGLAEVLRRIRRPSLRGILVGALILWGVLLVRLYDIRQGGVVVGDDLTKLVLGRPAHTPRIGTPEADIGELRAEFLEIFTDPGDGLLRLQLLRSLDEHRWPLGAGFAVPLLGGLALLAWGLDRSLRKGGGLRRRRLVSNAVLAGVLWIVLIEVGLVLDDQSWREHALVWREAAQASVQGDRGSAEAILRGIPETATQHVAAEFLLAYGLAELGRGAERIPALLALVGGETPHRYPPIGFLPLSEMSLLERIDHEIWLVWIRRVRDEGIQ